MILDLDRQGSGRSTLPVTGEVELGLGDLCVERAELSGELAVQDLESRVLVNGDLKAAGPVECARCLTGFHLDWDVPVEIMILRDIEADESEGQAVLIQQRDGEVDLRDALRECAAVAYPQSAVCRKDCRGLCPTCGADRNVETCACADEETDPRWENLP